jgi:hypothetical protein
MAHSSLKIAMGAADIGTSRVIPLNDSSTDEAARTMHLHDVDRVVAMMNTLVGMLHSGIVTPFSGRKHQ